MWSPQQFTSIGNRNGANPEVIKRACHIGKNITNKNRDIFPLFTLKHLSELSGVSHKELRLIVSRNNEDPYRVFKIKKKSDKNKFRIIATPENNLLRVQTWINRFVLSKAAPHTSSTAYFPNSTLYNAASPHCKCRWLVKLDIQNFFESITEISVFRAFRSLGYEPLMSFELTRICTRLGSETQYRKHSRWNVADKSQKIATYKNRRMGHLPQGAPTSPMLSNLVVKNLDQEISDLACSLNLIYTRYADDICITSSDHQFTRRDAVKLIGSIYSIISKHGFSPNISKTKIVPPGARKVVLGLLVDGSKPKLTRQYKSNIRRHLYYLNHSKIGPVKHAEKIGFASIISMKKHIKGLISHSIQIEPEYGRKCLLEFENISWPL